MRAVAGLAVEPAAAVGGLDGLDRHRQRLGDQRAEPAHAPQQQRDDRRAGDPSPGADPVGQQGAQADAVVADEVGGVGDVPDQPVALAEQAQGHGGVVGAQHLVVGEQAGGAEERRDRRAAGDQMAVLAGEAAGLPVSYSVPRSTRTSSPVEQRVGAAGGAVASGATVQLWASRPSASSDARLGLGDDQVGAGEPVEQAPGGALAEQVRSR